MVIKDELQVTFKYRERPSILTSIFWYIFFPAETSEGVSLQLGNTKDFIISFDLKF